MHVWKASRYNTVRLHVSHTLLKGLPTLKFTLTHTDDIQSQVQVVHSMVHFEGTMCYSLSVYICIIVHALYVYKMALSKFSLVIYTYNSSVHGSACCDHLKKMENCSNGTSNCSHLEGGLLDGPGFGVFSLLMALLSVVLCALTILTIAALCMARTMSKHLRIFLINILAGVLMMGIAFVLFTTLSVILVFAKPKLPSIFLCHVLTSTLAVGVFSRPLNLALYSLVVLITVRFGKKDWKMLYSGLAVAINWLVVLVIIIAYLPPSVAAVQYFDGVACFPDEEDTGSEIVLRYIRVPIIAFCNLLPLAVSVVTPAYCLCYIRKHSISGNIGYKKAISRLALFLVTGNAVNVAGNLLLILAAVFSNASVSVYLLYGFGVLSLFPAPIFIIMFLKAVRDQMRAIITCHRSHSHQIRPQVPVEK